MTHHVPKLLLLLGALSVSACTRPDTAVVISQPALSASAPLTTDEADSQSQNAPSPLGASHPVLYSRDGAQVFSQTAQTTAPLQTEMQLNFVKASISDVARAIVSELLGEPLTIAEGVSGEITLTSRGAVPAKDALSALESLLADLGVALVQKEIGYALTPLAQAGRGTVNLRRPDRAQFGYALTIAPAKFNAPSDILGLIQPLKTERVTITADDSRRLFYLKGPEPDIRAALEAIALFDVDWLASRSVALIEARHVQVSLLKDELEAVQSGISGASLSGGYDLIALPRLNALLIATNRPETLKELKNWAARLDRPLSGDATQLHYYSAKYTPARDLAAAVSSVFGGSYSPPTTGETDSNSGSNRSSRSTPSTTSLSRGNSGVTLVPDELNNALIIRATPKEYREVEALLKRMDVQAPQVLIEATIIEVRLNDDLRYGVRWFLEGGATTDGQGGFIPSSSGGFSDLADAATGAQFPGLGYTYVNPGIRASIDTLASVTDVNVVSAPKIMVVNNQSASLQVGDEVPIVTQQSQSVGDPNAPLVSTVQLRNTGVILEVTPRINASQTIVLDVNQEVSDVTPTTTSGIDTPTIQQRRFSSTVAVQDGETIALGGLIRNSHADTETGIPVFKDIPLLGHAFRSQEITDRRTELMVFLTPRIIGDSRSARASLDYIRNQMQHLKFRLAEPPAL